MTKYILIMLTVVFTSTAAVLLTKEKDIIQHLYLTNNALVTINYTDLTLYYEEGTETMLFNSIQDLTKYVEDISLYNASLNGMAPELRYQVYAKNLYATVHKDSISIVYNGPDYSTTDNKEVFGTVATIPIKCDITPLSFPEEILMPYSYTSIPL